MKGKKIIAFACAMLMSVIFAGTVYAVPPGHLDPGDGALLVSEFDGTGAVISSNAAEETRMNLKEYDQTLQEDAENALVFLVPVGTVISNGMDDSSSNMEYIKQFNESGIVYNNMTGRDEYENPIPVLSMPITIETTNVYMFGFTSSIYSPVYVKGVEQDPGGDKEEPAEDSVPELPDFPVFVGSDSDREEPEAQPEIVQQYQSRDGKGEWVEYADGYWEYWNVGTPLVSWQYIDDIWYRFSTDGKMLTGWQYIDNAWYYLKDWGGMAGNEWIYWNDEWYYLHGSGKMAYNEWVLTNGKWYYLNNTGAMLKNTVTPDGYFVDDNGVWVE